MRFVPASHLQVGQVLATDLRLDKQRYILRRGVALTANRIRRICELGIQGAYIDDAFSEGLEIDNLISDELRFSARKGVQSLFTSLERQNERKAEDEVETIRFMVHDIVDEISCNRNIMANIIDLRTFDDYTFSHCVNVAVLSALIGSALRLTRDELIDLTFGAVIHDIGKVFVDLALLNKKDPLTDWEYGELKKHVQYGCDYLARNESISKRAKEAVLSHHERFDGRGYPNGLKGEDVSFFGRVISVSDVYDALVSNRPYRRGFLPSDAMEYIMAGYGTHFDPTVVDAFTKLVAPYPVGTGVQLSNGSLAIVVENFPSSGMRPKVRLIEDNRPSQVVLNLAQDRNTFNITIQDIVDLPAVSAPLPASVAP